MIFITVSCGQNAQTPWCSSQYHVDKKLRPHDVPHSTKSSNQWCSSQHKELRPMKFPTAQTAQTHGGPNSTKSSVATLFLTAQWAQTPCCSSQYHLDKELWPMMFLTAQRDQTHAAPHSTMWTKSSDPWCSSRNKEIRPMMFLTEQRDQTHDVPHSTKSSDQWCFSQHRAQTHAVPHSTMWTKSSDPCCSSQHHVDKELRPMMFLTAQRAQTHDVPHNTKSSDPVLSPFSLDTDSPNPPAPRSRWPARTPPGRQCTSASRPRSRWPARTPPGRQCISASRPRSRWPARTPPGRQRTSASRPRSRWALDLPHKELHPT